MTVLYQVDCSVASSGKRVAGTKRQVRWLWGIANEDALATGATGFNCRGPEHEVTLVWSITSGKRLILLDDKEVTFSTGRRTEGKFEHSWTASSMGHNVLTIIAYAAAPLRSIPGFKQFDLIINGQSYSDMCRIYELGLHEDHTKNHKPVAAANIGNGPLTRIRSHSLPIGAQQEINQVVLPRSNSVPYAHDLRSESSAIVKNGNASMASPAAQVDHYHTVGDLELNRDHPPSYETIWGTIMDANGSGITNQKETSSRYQTAEIDLNETSLLSQINPAVVNPTTHWLHPENTQTDSESVQLQTDGSHSNSGFLHVQTGNTDNDSKLLEADMKGRYNRTVVKSPRTVYGIDEAMQNLVNIEDILSPVFNTKLTMNSDHEKENRDKQSINSRGLPPKMGSERQFGRQLTLLELKHQQNSNKNIPSKEIMKTPHCAAEGNTFAMVVYPKPQQYINYSYSYPYIS